MMPPSNAALAELATENAIEQSIQRKCGVNIDFDALRVQEDAEWTYTPPTAFTLALDRDPPSHWPA